MVVAQRIAHAPYMWDYRSRPRTKEDLSAERARKSEYVREYRARVTKEDSMMINKPPPTPGFGLARRKAWR